MNIHQLSAHYISEEDRLLVRVNSTGDEELTLWLTRRLVLGFWPLLNKIVVDHVVPVANLAKFPLTDAHDKQMLVEFQRTETLGASDFKTPYKTAADKPGSGSQPLLVTEIELRPLESGYLQLKFLEKVPERDGAAATTGTAQEPRGFQLTLEPQLIHGLVHLLAQALAASLWWQSGELVLPGLAPINVQAVPLDKPKYLN